MATASRPTPTNPKPADFGPNVHIFDPSMPMADITSTIAPIFQSQDTNQFGPGRHAYFFKPGSYNLNVDVGYYMTVHGLGHSPNDVKITGGVQSLATSTQGLALNSFWRGVENLSIVPTTNGDISGWAVSQATFLRRVHIIGGQLFLFDWRYPTNYSSGGFIADSLIDKQIISGSQQQFLTRNTTLTNWIGGVWNMVFVGDDQPPSGSWPDQPFTVVEKTPVIREKPYLIFENDYAVQVPNVKRDSQGTSWSNVSDSATTLPISQFYIAKAATDTADSINQALHQGYHLILTPGVYHLSRSLEVQFPNTVILGLGMATLVPNNGTPAMVVHDVGGVSISGIIFDAGPIRTSQLLVIGGASSTSDHNANPTALFDICCRVGGAAAGSTLNCITIHSNNVILDNIWIWRADHGNPGAVGWTVNAADNGLTVEGHDVIAYGLFVEHFQKLQTVWNGNGGQVYMYQSEIPYDPPDQPSWQQPTGSKGYASYKVGDRVSSHTAKGLGIYCNFNNQVELDNAIETPTGPGIQLNHLTTQWLDGKPFSAINHIINGTGDRGSFHAVVLDRLPLLKALFFSLPVDAECTYDMRRKQKDFSLSGGYRKMLARIGETWEVSVHEYGEADADKQFVETDLEKLKKGDQRGNEEGSENPNGHAPTKQAEKEDAVMAEPGTKLAAVLKFQLGSSQYATMALRELSKGGVQAYKSDFMGGR